MKKMMLLTILAILILTLTACGRDVIKVTAQEIYDETINKGTDALVKNIYEVTGMVGKVEDDHLKVEGLKVYCDTDGFAEGDLVTFKGRIAEISQEIIVIDKVNRINNLTIYVDFKNVEIQ